MTRANDKEMWCAYKPRLLTFVVTGALLLVSVCAEYTMACCVTDVDLYVREMPEDEWGEYVIQCSDVDVYFMAECQVDADPDECRPLEWRFYFGDGDWTYLYTYSSTSGPCSGGTFSKTTSHAYNSGGYYEPFVVVERVGVADCAWLSDTCQVTIVGVEITDAPDYVLVYTGSEAGNQPTETATAVGSPSGGTYTWDPIYIGSGRISLSGSTSNEVTIMGTEPSSDPPKDDVFLDVEYSLSGGEPSCGTSVSLRVRRMSSTTSHEGVVTELGSGPMRRVRRYYYHRIKDQFDDVIDETGIPCGETVTWQDGEKGWVKTSPGSTGTCSPDGGFSGGIAVQDKLECAVTMLC